MVAWQVRLLPAGPVDMTEEASMAHINAAKLRVHDPAYADLAPQEKPFIGPTEWFGTGAAEGYIDALLERFSERHSEAGAELAYIANQAKWSVGWKGLGRQILERLG